MADLADIPEDPAKRALWAFSQPGVLELTHSWVSDGEGSSFFKLGQLEDNVAGMR